MTRRQIWTLGLGLFLLVVSTALAATLAEIKQGDGLDPWTPIPIHTQALTPTPTGGWWEGKPTPPFSSRTPTSTTTSTPTPTHKEETRND